MGKCQSAWRIEALPRPTYRQAFHHTRACGRFLETYSWVFRRRSSAFDDWQWWLRTQNRLASPCECLPQWECCQAWYHDALCWCCEDRQRTLQLIWIFSWQWSLWPFGCLMTSHTATERCLSQSLSRCISAWPCQSNRADEWCQDFKAFWGRWFLFKLPYASLDLQACISHRSSWHILPGSSCQDRDEPTHRHPNQWLCLCDSSTTSQMCWDQLTCDFAELACSLLGGNYSVSDSQNPSWIRSCDYEARKFYLMTAFSAERKMAAHHY